MVYSWFRYDGSGSIYNQLNYNALGAKPTCMEGSSICAIYAEVQLIGSPRTERPVITDELTLAINFAIANCIPTANVRLKDY